MERKSYTVILVPHARARFRKFQVSNIHLWAVALATTLLLTASGFIGWTHFTAPVDEQQVDDLRKENDQLRQVNQRFEEGIRDLQGQLDAYEERTRQLAIVAGLEELGGGPESGLGGGEVFPTSGPEALGAMALELDGLHGQLSSIEGSFEERLRWMSAVPSVRPTEGLFTSGYGNRRDPITGRRAMHYGLDISARPGKPVLATADGLVVKSGRMGRLGNAVYLSHGYGLTTRYGHMSRTVVKAGDQVRRGDVIGYVGNTGRSTGYHLHYEVRQDGRPVNPLGYILDRSNG